MGEKNPDIDHDAARERLAAERERVERSLAQQKSGKRGALEEIGGESVLADAGGQIEQEEVDDALAESLRRELAAIERAQARIEDGSYGLSVESGDPIPAERLDAVPWAERTPSEQERFERTHGRPW